METVDSATNAVISSAVEASTSTQPIADAPSFALPPTNSAPATEAIRSEPPSPIPSQDSDDDTDDLPAVGKVWEGSTESLSSLMAKRRAATAMTEPTNAPLTISSPQPSIVPSDSHDLPVLWQAILAELSSQVMLHSLVSQGELLGIDDGRAIMRFPARHETFIKAWEKNGKKDIIRDAATRALGRSMGVKFELAAKVELPAPPKTETSVPPASRKAGPRPPSVPEAVLASPEPTSIKITNELVDSLAKQIPLIKSVMHQLGGQVIKVE